MKFANASKLDRKSGVRWGEHGAPVQNRRLRLAEQTPLALGDQRSQTVGGRRHTVVQD
jgi:hypothetical protein